MENEYLLKGRAVTTRWSGTIALRCRCTYSGSTDLAVIAQPKVSFVKWVRKNNN
jgi:hypothetical protein